MKMFIGVVLCVTVGLFSAAGSSAARAADHDTQIRPCTGFCCETDDSTGDCRVCIHAGEQCP
ncbi:MAG TPA: hypothetical protein VFP84_02975 [Kofleriaceae bacterium]|nr:hypothetical protein [Kofleriaceae bacterium]